MLKHIKIFSNIFRNTYIQKNINYANRINQQFYLILHEPWTLFCDIFINIVIITIFTGA